MQRTPEFVAPNPQRLGLRSQPFSSEASLGDGPIIYTYLDITRDLAPRARRQVARRSASGPDAPRQTS